MVLFDQWRIDAPPYLLPSETLVLYGPESVAKGGVLQSSHLGYPVSES